MTPAASCQPRMIDSHCAEAALDDATYDGQLGPEDEEVGEVDDEGVAAHARPGDETQDAAQDAECQTDAAPASRPERAPDRTPAENRDRGEARPGRHPSIVSRLLAKVTRRRLIDQGSSFAEAAKPSMAAAGGVLGGVFGEDKGPVEGWCQGDGTAQTLSLLRSREVRGRAVIGLYMTGISGLVSEPLLVPVPYTMDNRRPSFLSTQGTLILAEEREIGSVDWHVYGAYCGYMTWSIVITIAGWMGVWVPQAGLRITWEQIDEGIVALNKMVYVRR